MPAQVADWPQVKATAIGTGSLKEAADAHGIEYGAVRVRAHREEWPVGRRVHKLAQQAQELASAQIIRASGGRVTGVTSAADALTTILAENKKRTKLALSSYLGDASEELQRVPDKLSVTDAALQLATMASKVYPEDHQEAQVSLQFFSITQERAGTEYASEHQVFDLPLSEALDDPML